MPDEERQLPLDCKTLYEIARRFSPVLNFHEQERFFPALAESWLTHTSAAPWTEDPAHHLGDLPPDPHRRGMALIEVPGVRHRIIDSAKYFVHAGQPVGADRPLQLSTVDGDPYAIGRAALAEVDRQTFLDLAGWLDDDMTTGDLERLYGLFSELAAACNQNLTVPTDPAWQPLRWTPLAGLDDLPHAWVPQPVNPTTYCEASWARTFPEINDQHNLRDYPAGDSSLNGYLALTYHYLFPAKEPGLNGVGRRLEGQWESITLFFRGEGQRGHDGGLVWLPPEYVVASQGIEQDRADHHRTELRPWNQVARLDGTDHPVLYVAKGTHHMYFEPVAGQTTDPHANPKPGSNPGEHDDARHDTTSLVLTLISEALLGLAAVAAALAVLLGPAFWPVAGFLALLAALFHWLADLFDDDDNDSSGQPVPGSSGNDEASPAGTQAGGAEEPADPASGSPAPGRPGEPGTVGLANTGSPTGRSTVSFDVRLIDGIFDPEGRRTGYPSEERCERPTWWDYSGGWGVRSRNRLASGWDHGTRRIDEFQRPWAYWSSLRLSTVLHGGAPQG